MNSNQIIYLSGLVISLLLTILSFSLHFMMKRQNRRKSFELQNSSDSIWAFTKRNFWMFTGSFSLVMIFSFAALLLSTT